MAGAGTGAAAGAPAILDLCGRQLSLARPRVMGILNRTPDSFSDGGTFTPLDAALRRVEQMTAEGADIIDVGGQSTRPGALPVTAQVELDRVCPVIEGASQVTDIPLCVDTSKAIVMQAALDAGAAMINDVCALQGDGALEVAAGGEAAVCLMHMQGSPRAMQAAPHYDNVVGEVCAFLVARRQVCMDAGIAAQRIVVDPGFGFGKTLEHNLTLLRQLHRLARLGAPLLCGLSRKSMIGALLDAPVHQRVHGSVAAAVLAAQRGAHILRVHDVAATVQGLRIFSAVRNGQDAH